MFRGCSATSCPTCSSKSYVSPKYLDDSILLWNLQSDWISMQRLELQRRMHNSKMKRSCKHLHTQIEQKLHTCYKWTHRMIFFCVCVPEANSVLQMIQRLRKEDMNTKHFSPLLQARKLKFKEWVVILLGQQKHTGKCICSLGLTYFNSSEKGILFETNSAGFNRTGKLTMPTLWKGRGHDKRCNCLRKQVVSEDNPIQWQWSPHLMRIREYKGMKGKGFWCKLTVTTRQEC